MANRPPHSRPAHPHLTAVPTLQDEPAPESGIEPTPRAHRSRTTRSSARLHSVDSGAVTSDPAEAEEPRPAKDDPFQIGRTLAGRYRIERLLGEGSMGVVVLALHLALDEHVAVKFIRREQRHDPLAVARFAREAKALARLKTDHVPRLLDVGRSLGIGPYIVMEYLEGHDLGEVLRSRGTLEEPRAVSYVLEACEALAVAHDAGITHQDLKPENLFLAQHGQLESIKLLDFGISKGSLEGRIFGEDLTRSSPGLMGTPLYMSPERVRNEADLDHRSDIWSLGIVLHELVTGRTPFTGESVTEICAQVLENGSPVLATASLSPELEAVILRCLSRDPAERFQTIADLASALAPLAPPPQPFFGRLSQEIPRISLAPAAPAPAAPAAARTDRTPTRRMLALTLLPALAAAVLGVAFNLTAPTASPATPTPREDLAASTTLVAFALNAAPPYRPAAPSRNTTEPRSRQARRHAPAPRSTTLTPTVPSSATTPPETGTSLTSPRVEATPLGRVRLLEDRPRARLVENNPRLSPEPPKSSSQMRSRARTGPEPYSVR